ncbi:hypothetical protein HOC37_01765 [bacterium]|nr:hypothetical protein [bacterium]MBT3581953.1 hypothetical protein [bacterium]MBT4551694.1 hypothetical protein [bacterium]
MNKQFLIDIFLPPFFEKKEFDIKRLNKLTNKNFIYASKGRYAFYHALKALALKDKILVPVYICRSVLESLEILKITPIFYDLDKEDLNASIDSIRFLAEKYSVKALLVASMYGNPANLVEIERYCKQNNILLIDDAAQSFGAKLDERMLGTFGDAGFFSFSPGKPTAGHMGAFFWTNNPQYRFKKTTHNFLHFLTYLDFYFNRFKIYQYRKYKIFNFFSLLKRIYEKYIDITFDKMENFEEEILGGVLEAAIGSKFDFRQKYVQEFKDRFRGNSYFRVIRSIRGEARPHKFVIMAKGENLAKDLMVYLKDNKIYCSNGYQLLTNDLRYLPNAEKINKRIIEIPIENNRGKMDYLFEILQKFRA